VKRINLLIIILIGSLAMIPIAYAVNMGVRAGTTQGMETVSRSYRGVIPLSVGMDVSHDAVQAILASYYCWIDDEAVLVANVYDANGKLLTSGKIEGECVRFRIVTEKIPLLEPVKPYEVGLIEVARKQIKSLASNTTLVGGEIGG